MKKGLFLILSIFALILSSCSFGSKTEKIVDDNGEIITKRKLDFIADKKSQFEVSNGVIPTYFFGNGIPYVSIDDFINGISFYDANVIVSDEYDYRFVVKGYNKHLKLNYDKNQMIIYDFEIFSIDEKQYIEDINYNKYLLMNIDEIDEDAHAIINLSEYDLHIKKVDNKLVVPFHIINSLFSISSYYYLYFTGDAYYGYSLCDNYITSTSLKKHNKIKFDDAYIKYNYNVLRLTFNEFYGLKYDDKDNILELLDADKESFLDPKKYLSATKKFISELEDCHTSYVGMSDLIETDYTAYRSEREQNQTALRTRLGQYYNYEFNSYSASGLRVLDETTAIISFSSFTIDNEVGTLINLYLNLKQCETLGIQNVILDVTQNGGGDTFALAQTLGLMTNDDIVLDFYNVRTNHATNEIFKVDANLDGDFTDLDAFTNFNYYILSSGYTYSCAHDFVGYCKRHNIAKIIGKKTGGGSCCVAPISTPTGGLIIISGLDGIKGNGIDLCEYGVDVDYEIEYENIYKKDYLIGAINSFNI